MIKVVNDLLTVPNAKSPSVLQSLDISAAFDTLVQTVSCVLKNCSDLVTHNSNGYSRILPVVIILSQWIVD